MNRSEYNRVGLLIPLAPVLLPAIPKAAAVSINAAEFFEKAAGGTTFLVSFSPRCEKFRRFPCSQKLGRLH
jgi:hypothetical protein